jgi:hypothetical protein
MLKLFGAGGPDHPMRNAKEARRILDALPAEDVEALGELAHWHESVSVTEGFKAAERIPLVLMIDEAAQPRLRKLSREYFGASRPSRFQEHRMWTQLHEYWKQAGLACGRATDSAAQAARTPDALPLVATRALRSLAQQIKWQHMRYGPIDASVWGILSKVYALCEARGVADAKVSLYASVESSPRLEFLKAAIFSAASPDSLLAAQVELAERVIGELTASFMIANAPAPGLLYWIDLGRPMLPQRIVKPPQAAPGLRCFGPGNAMAALQAQIQRIEATRPVPASLGTAQDPDSVLEVLRHLATVWSPEPPERKHARHNVKSRVSIAHSFAGVVEALGGSADDDKKAENWVVENVSAGGFGAVVPQFKTDWLRVGALLAMQPDGGTNWVIGAVRRLNRISNQEARVGIETLSRAPRLARFQLRGIGEHTGIVLPAAVLGSGEVSVALRAGVYAPGQNLETTIDGRSHVYLPQGAIDRSDDCDIIRFREMIREA